MELRDYWLTIRRRWKLVVGCFVVALAAAGLFTWQATPQYSSSAQLFVSTASSDTSEALTGGQFATQRVASYVDLVGTRNLAEKVAAALGDGETAEKVRAAVSAEAVPETVNLVITATDPDPVEAQRIAQTYAEQLADLVSEIETPEGRGTAPIRASIVDRAAEPSTPVSPNVTRNLALGAVLGLLVGIGAAVLRDLLDTSITSAAAVGEITDTPILATIVGDTGAVKRSPVEALQSATPWAEAFRVLRTNMQYVDVDRDHRVFVVSSALPGEGKSTIAADLGVTLSLAGESVCIVECDLRRPTFARRHDLDDGVGTTSVLIGRVTLDDALQTYGEGLAVLTCGPRPPNPSELLQSNAMEQLIDELRSRYDIVLLDAPPLLPVTDAALLAARADGMLAVVRHGRTTRDQLRHALERVESVGARCVGVVINMAPSKKGAPGYGYGYGYGYEYTPNPDEDTKAPRKH